MSATIIDGKAIAQEVRAGVAEKVKALKEKGVNLIEAQYNSVPLEYKLGMQACYDPINKTVILNTDKSFCIHSAFMNTYIKST